MIIRELTLENQPALEQLIQIIEDQLPNHDWWLPIQETAKVHFFDPSWTIFCGAFEGDSLVGASALFLNEFEFKDAAKHINLPLSGTAEIGRCMVNPENRGHNIMLEMNKVLLKRAKEKGIKRILSTAHPDNMASCHSLLSLGMHKAGEVIKYTSYKRNIYLIEL